MVQIDIEMPVSCEDCPFNDDNWSCIINGRGIDLSRADRPETCPLREADKESKPHN